MGTHGSELTCPSCGKAAPADRRFCSRCGARLPAPQPPTAPPASAPAPAPQTPPETPPAPVRPPQQQQQRWALDTPPANENWWRNPIVVVAAAVSILFGGGVASWRFFISTGSEVAPLVRPPFGSAPGASTTSPPTETTESPVADPADEAATAVAIGRIVRRSEAGRRALRRLDYDAALNNRRQLVAAMDRLDVPPQPEQLARAAVTLRRALAASARADEAHIACGCDERLPQDVAAHGLKHQFATQFDPYARRYLGHPVDPERI